MSSTLVFQFVLCHIRQILFLVIHCNNFFIFWGGVGVGAVGAVSLILHLFSKFEVKINDMT